MSYAWGNQADAGEVYVSVKRDDGNKIVTSRELEKLSPTDERRIYRYIYDNLASDGSFSGCTKNCEDALRRFRLQDKPRTLWVDAICINQKDNVEKTRQVQIMGHIYRYADRVIVYSGQAENPKWTNLLSPSYFRRLWPVQELLHAQKIRLYYGKTSIDWDVLAEDYDTWKRDVGPMETRSTASTVLDSADFFELRQWYLIQPSRPVHLLDTSQLKTLMLMISRLECKVSLDKFYAIQSLFYGELYDNIEPEYTISMDDLNQQLVRILAREARR
ncbi:hypothetical protein LTR95_015273 [Oleoguttula sp. CCFEE 5521]